MDGQWTYDEGYEKVEVDSQHTAGYQVASDLEKDVVAQEAHDTLAGREMKKRKQSERQLDSLYDVAPKVELTNRSIGQHGHNDARYDRNGARDDDSFPTSQIYLGQALHDELTSVGGADGRALTSCQETNGPNYLHGQTVLVVNECSLNRRNARRQSYKTLLLSSCPELLTSGTYGCEQGHISGVRSVEKGLAGHAGHEQVEQEGQEERSALEQVLVSF